MDIKFNVDRVSNGLYILLFGFVFLWMSLGFIKWNMIFQIVRLWPLLLIVLGLDLILRRTTLSSLRIFIPIIVIGAVFGLLNIAQNGNLFQPRITEKQIISSGVFSMDKNLDININFSSGKFMLSDGAGGGFKAELSLPQNENPNLVHKAYEKNDLYEISDSDISNYVFSPWDGDHIWDFRLDKGISGKINARTYASVNEMDLSQLSVNELGIDSNLSSSRIVLALKNVKLNINANASVVMLEIPKKIGVRIKLDKAFISDNLTETGMVQGFKEFTSLNYKDSEKKADIYLNLKFSKLDVKFY